MKMAIEMITPAYAKQVLDDLNSVNRPKNNSSIEKFARDMKTGRWTNNGQSVVFSETGKLLDGQHRMAAVLLSGVNVGMVVVRDVPEDVFPTLDNGKARSLSDVLSIEGYSHPTMLASVAKSAFNYICGRSQLNGINKTELNEFIIAHPNLTKMTNRVYAATAGYRFPRAPLATALALANESGKYDPEVKEFLDGLSTGQGLWKGDPRLTLRDWLARHRAGDSGGDKGRYLKTETVFSAAGKAWTAFAQGNEMSMLTKLSTPTRANLRIHGYDPSLFKDVPDLGTQHLVKRLEAIRTAKKRSSAAFNIGEYNRLLIAGKTREEARVLARTNHPDYRKGYTPPSAEAVIA